MQRVPGAIFTENRYSLSEIFVSHLSPLPLRTMDGAHNTDGKNFMNQHPFILARGGATYWWKQGVSLTVCIFRTINEQTRYSSKGSWLEEDSGKMSSRNQKLFKEKFFFSERVN